MKFFKGEGNVSLVEFIFKVFTEDVPYSRAIGYDLVGVVVFY